MKKLFTCIYVAIYKYEPYTSKASTHSQLATNLRMWNYGLVYGLAALILFNCPMTSYIVGLSLDC